LEAAVEERFERRLRSGRFERFACRMPEMFRYARQMATKVAEYKTKRGYSADGTNSLRKR
jgi:hypothetical protein